MDFVSDEILSKYANVLVNFALNSGQGIKPQEVVLLNVPSSAHLFLPHLQKAVLQANANYIINFIPDFVQPNLQTDLTFFNNSNNQQVSFFPDKYYRGLLDQCDHFLTILADADPHRLKTVDPAKIMTRQQAFKPYMEWRQAKEYEGKFTWTLALFGTPAMAQEAGLSLTDYWQQIVNGCLLDQDDPVNAWQQTQSKIELIRNKLNTLSIEKLHIVAKDTDLYISLGANRQWLGGGGRNIPSFEIFTSPDWRGTQGHISFNQPLYMHGQKVTNIKLKFEQGRVIESHADQGEELLHQMIKTPNADKIGEFSLTDSRFSRITKFMAHTLFDENIGGERGNTHIALGQAYKDTCTLPYDQVSSTAWDEMGFNDSAVHTDIISTTDRTITAILHNESEKVIYTQGQFTI